MKRIIPKVFRSAFAGTAFVACALCCASGNTVFAGDTATPLPTPEAAARPLQPPMISNGNFEKDDGHGWPADWVRPKDGVSWQEEDGNHYLHFELLRPTQFVRIPRTIDLKPGAKAYRLTVRARYKDMHYGPEMWNDGRIILSFQDKDGATLPQKPSDPHWNKGSKDWKSYATDFTVPDGAVKLSMMLCLIRVKSGTLDLDDLALEPIPEGPVLEQEKAYVEKKAAEAAKQIAGVKPKVSPAPTDKLPPELHVEGKKILTADGKEVWLQGLAVPSLEWCEGGEHMLQSVDVGIHEWKANCIRLPIRAQYWFGKGPYRHDGGAQYKQIVDDILNLCAANGVYLVIDLHGFTAPGNDDVKFWGEVAQRYKNHPAAIFELFNEPHDISWEIWRNGGVVIPPKKFPDAPPEDQEQPKEYQAAGMQKLLDAVRATGAKNVVIAGGLDWGYDLSGVTHGFALEEHGGNGIIYSSHIYPWKKDWQAKVLDAAASHPIFVGEIGAPPDYSNFQFIKESERYPLEGWVEDALGMIQKYKLNWTAWSFHPQSGPCVISDLNYTPTPYWGAYVKDALAGKLFEMKRMR